MDERITIPQDEAEQIPGTHISATIITNNEASIIKRCLKSLEGIADEIIVVDSGSTDGTPDICRKAGCQVYQRRFTGYGIQRQYAASLCKHTYILAIDADEVLDDELRQTIIKLKKEGMTHRVYAFNIMEYYFGHKVRHTGLKRSGMIRLFNKRYAQWNLRDVREQVTFPESLRPQKLEGTLLHFRAVNYSQMLLKELSQARLRAAALAARYNRISPLRPHITAIATYFKYYIEKGGWMDGRTGAMIAQGRAYGTYMAWKIARKTLRENALC